MSMDVAEPTRGPIAADRSLAFLAYGLFFFATFTFGLLALVAVVIAFVRRASQDPVARSHFRSQIRGFWIDLVLIVTGAVAGYLALAGGLGALIGLSGARLPGGVSTATVGWTALALGAVWAVLWIWGFLNLIVGSLFGAARLASGRPMGQLPEP
jgi:uncharacterized membrane protein